ncbi:MAG: hypothetical protein JNK82_41250 [Myxococcaceae bacterium]|nr:hypothetical protein [Myxococcaceae bacterium]
MRLVLSAGVAAFGLFACAHTVTNEERLEGMTDVTVSSVEEATEMRCRETSPEIQLARDRSHQKAQRLASYKDALADATQTQARFDDVFKKEPDLVYGPQAAEWKRKVTACSDLIATLTKEQKDVEREVEAAPVVAPAAAPAPAAPAAVADSAADEAFSEDDDADSLRSTYKKSKSKAAKAKIAKAKKAAAKKKKAKAGLALR